MRLLLEIKGKRVSKKAEPSLFAEQAHRSMNTGTELIALGKCIWKDTWRPNER